jgi:hypothetical protein
MTPLWPVRGQRSQRDSEHARMTHAVLLNFNRLTLAEEITPALQITQNKKA